MNIGKAFAVFQQIESKKYTKDEKYEAIHDVINAATINSITKKQVLNVVSWLFNKQQKYRWHDLRKNPTDLPDVPHPERTWFEVVQEDNEDCIPRATMQCYEDLLPDIQSGKLDRYIKQNHPESYNHYGIMVAMPRGCWKADKSDKKITDRSITDEWHLVIMKKCGKALRRKSLVELLFCMLRAKGE